MNEKTFTTELKKRLLIEFSIQDRSGVYGYTQRSMAYNSNKIEGSTLTERQTASLFDTGSFYPDSENDIFRAKDVEEPDEDEINSVYFALKKFEDLEEQNLLAIIPAKIGSKLYTVILGKIEEYTITGYSINENGVWLADLEFESNGRIYTRTLETEEIGKKWFLTRKEAESEVQK